MLLKLFYLYTVTYIANSKTIEYTPCNDTIIIPCYISNPTKYITWKLDNHVIIIYNKTTSSTMLSKWHKSAKLRLASENDMSLIIKYKDILPGNYTCSDSTGVKSNIQLVFKETHWFNDYDTMLIFIFSGVTLVLLLLQVIYTSISIRFTNNVGILQFFCVIIIMIELSGSLLFYPSKFNMRHIIGLLMLTIPSIFLIVTKIFSFWVLNKLSFGVHVIIYYQLAGYVLTILGLGLSLKECVIDGSLLLSGLGIISISEHFSLLLLVCFQSIHREYY
ncbi:integral membrane protein [Yokapox virus]|uniref:Protein OPG166 n=1 Tax=Yokapox virus TaxID=1076255 RepID=G3EI36_9POXV|nr:integral membrane protein [Yokapox virus]AEN03733.1 integral membrane protein [Yokapox virus]